MTPIHAQRKSALISNWFETGVFAALSVWTLCLMATAFTSAGPLWRDEINTRWMAMRPSVAELWRWMDKDSFPLLWFGVVRAWIGVGFGQTDLGLRALGLLVGAGALAAIVYASRLQGRRWPLLCVALFALNPVMFRFATSLRAYGMGVLTMIVMVGTLWAYVDRPTSRRWIWGLIASLLAVQTLYYNCVVVGVMVIAGMGALLASKRHREAGLLFLIGGLSAASVVPYILGPLSRTKGFELVPGTRSIPLLFKGCIATMELSAGLLHWVWLGIAVVVYAGIVGMLLRSYSRRHKSRAIFLIVALPLIWVFHFGFLLILGFLTQPWYYVTLLGFTALMLDRGAETLIGNHAWGRSIRLALVVIMAICTVGGDWTMARTRATTVDLAASTVTQNASPDDFIVVSPWFLGIPFDRYYHGATPWSTIPPLNDHHLHRYDLIKGLIDDPDAVKPLVTKIANVLQSGHRVWFVGLPDFRKQNAPPSSFDSMSPSDRAQAWEKTIAITLEHNAAGMEEILYCPPQPVSDYEVPPVLVFRPRVPR